MKKTLVSVALLFASMSIVTACKDNESKIVDAQEEVLESKQELLEAKQDSLTDYENFKLDINEKIMANEIKIADWKVKGVDGTAAAKANYNKRVERLEERNKELKEKLNNYTNYKAETWEAFKTDIDNSTKELEKEFSEFSTTKEN